MRAVYLVPGSEGGVYEYRDAPVPKADGSQVLVEVRAAGTNRGEILMVGGYRSDNPAFGPVPAGIEFAGDIVEVGPDATGWHVGERVMGRSRGCYAEFVIAGAMNLMRIPDHMSYVEAAAIPNVFVTAHDALVTNGQLAAGESVVVTAASSGIGTATMQLAGLFEASTIIATTRNAHKAAGLSSLGADLVIDTSSDDYVKTVLATTDDEGVDVIIDSVGGQMLADNVAAIAIGGRIVSVGRNGGTTGNCNLDYLANQRAQLIGVTFRTRSPREAWRCFEVFLEDCQQPFADGRLKGIVDRTFPLDALHDAHRYMMSDAQLGKIVLENAK